LAEFGYLVCPSYTNDRSCHWPLVKNPAGRYVGGAAVVSFPDSAEQLD